MTDVIHDAIEKMTGYRPNGCPWAVFVDPFVHRVLEAYQHREHGNLAWASPRPSHRLVQGVGFYGRALDGMQARQLDEQRMAREEAAKHGR